MKETLEKDEMFDGLTDEDLIEEYEEVHHKRHKVKHFVVYIAIFSALLMMSYLYLGYPVYGILIGQIDSSRVSDNTLVGGGATIVFFNDTLDVVIQAYHDNPDVETVLCLEGSVESDIWRVSNVYQPEILSQSWRHVSHRSCSNDTIVKFHTHPYKYCTASRTDVNTLRSAQEQNPDVIMIIMCEPNRFSLIR